MAAIFLLLFLLLNSSRRLIFGIERLASNEVPFKSRNVGSTTNCGPPKPFEDNTELKWRPNARNQSVFLPGENAEFVCKKGFRQIGWLQTLTCQKNGSWSPRSSSIRDGFRSGDCAKGYCLSNNCNGSEVFNCSSGSKAVSICKKCDCNLDCPDGSDEFNCGPILVNFTGRAVGEITSPKSDVKNYTGHLTCRRTLWTDDPGFYIKLLFTDFAMSGHCEDNYIYLENATFSGTDSSPNCCKKNTNVSCAFGNGTGAPSLAHTNRNFMIVNYVSKDSNSPSFSAKWFNVNGNFPRGLIPKEDSHWGERITIPRSKPKNVKDDATDPTYIAAVVIFSLIVFAVLAIVSCKVGRHLLGPRCSVGYCCSWIAARRHLQSPRLSPRREGSPETRPTEGNIQNERTRLRTQRNVPVDAGGSLSLRTRYGSGGEGVA
ncbi:uncharacterized protein LOC111320993 [Stylophora pistillata]|uniref:CUB domain-containing protein n=1 Tax=Stylophora pistillata TaxID=50429 RepID=A0A2B4STJ3_STYPI|nr:uncharacterized protein LOC111320993 [Stylophora pistillata]PFX32383.1 hypothetical protein AWC38_SpisGene2818 [Stylophora pistillata]